MNCEKFFVEVILIIGNKLIVIKVNKLYFYNLVNFI